MERNQDLFKQAILDARAVRETAMAAARTSLAEHFEPMVKTMFKETVEGIEEKKEEDMKETKHHDMEEAKKMHADMEEGMDLDESTLDEILAELDALSEGDDDSADIEEGHVKGDGYDGKASKGNTGYDEKAKATHGDHKLHEAEEDEAEEDETEDDAEAEVETPEMGDDAVEGTDEQEVVDITVGDLKDIIRDVFMQLQGGDTMDAMDAGTDLAADLGTGDEGGEAEISLDEILAELEAEDDKVEEGAGTTQIPGGKITPGAGDVNKVQFDEMKKDLNEAVKTIKTLKTELNEINLFSAKLLYVNKIFKAKNLNEAQKTKVINAFDRAETLKEVENTYKTLFESLSAVTKKTGLKESVGLASRPIGSAPARPIVEADAFVTRWQTLAGIK